MDILDFLDGENPPIENVQPVEVAPVETPAPVEQIIETPPAPLEPPIVEHKPDPGFVPISVVLDERDKRKKLEEQLANVQAQQQPKPAQQAPDVFEDPQGYAAHQNELATRQALNVKLDLSEDNARDKYGDETVDTARDWAIQQFQNRPGFYEQVITQRNPYKFVVEQYQREQIASQVTTDDFEQFQAWKAAQAQLTQPVNVTTAPQPSSPPPPSIASMPSAGGVQHTPTGPGVAFDDVFK